MKSNFQLKYQKIAYIKGFEESIKCALVLKDGRIAIGSKYLKIYDERSFNFDFEISLKKYLDESEKNFTFRKLIYLKNGNILINNDLRIFFIIQIIDRERKYNILQKFYSNLRICWYTRICELSNNSIATIGVPYEIEIFSKDKNNKYYSSKVIKNAHKRDGYKTFIEIPNNKIMTFSSKLSEFKVWDLNNYECIYKGEIVYPECNYMVYLIFNRYVLINCNDGLTIIDINNHYNMHLVLENVYIYSMIRIDEKEFLLLTEKDIRKIKLNMDKLEFKVEQSNSTFFNKKGYQLGNILIKLNSNTYLTNFERSYDSTLLIFQFYNNFNDNNK